MNRDKAEKITEVMTHLKALEKVSSELETAIYIGPMKIEVKISHEHHVGYAFAVEGDNEETLGFLKYIKKYIDDGGELGKTMLEEL